VESAEFNLVTSQLKVIGDQRTMSRPAIVQIVEKAGHKVEAEDKAKSAVFQGNLKPWWVSEREAE